jgi:Tol biopolymer transport system component
MTRLDYLKVSAAVIVSALAATLVMSIAVKPTEAAFPGRNGKIAFDSFPPPPSSSDVYVMNADGSGKKNLTKSNAGEGDQTFSSNGKRIAFSRLRVVDSDIWVMNADGSNPRRITKNPANENEPTWSPDGTRIAFTTDRDGNSEIYVKRLAGGMPKNLTNNPTGDFGPSWSPNGKWIAFAREGAPPNFDRDIFRMRTDGSNQIDLTTSPTSDDIRPDWHPNSASIVYQSNLDILRMGSDGSNQTNLTNDPAEDFAPVFSPAGKSIAFTSDRDGDDEIFRMSSGGLNPVNLTNNAKPLDGFPSWQPRPRR